MATAADYGRVRSSLVLVLVSLLAVPALTASNGIPGAPAGAGAGSVSGYAVSAISYSLDAETIDGVSFRLSPANARTVRARLAPSEPWSECSVTGGEATCAVETELGEATALEVVAAS